MKFLIPILVVLFLIIGAVAFWKFSGKPTGALQTNQTANTSGEVQKQAQAPITGNPDDIDSTINQAAQDEGNTAITNGDESSVVDQNNNQAASVGDSYDENSF